jgi:hypothetical protein
MADLRSLGEQIARDLDACVKAGAKPGPVKAFRDAANEPARQRFQASIDRLDEFGWSWQRIADCLGCTKTHVIGVYHGHSHVQAYMLDELDKIPELQALPARMRAEQLKRAG